MKKLLLLVLIPTISFAGFFVAGPESETVYSNKEECEKFYKKTCFDKGSSEDQSVMVIEKTVVNDTTKPIYAIEDATQECGPIKIDPPRRKPLVSRALAEDVPVIIEPPCQMVCQEDWELFNEKQCRFLKGYEQMEIEQLVIDPKKVAERDLERERIRLEKEAELAALQQKEAERAALKAKIDATENPTPEDIKAALKLLL